MGEDWETTANLLYDVSVWVILGQNNSTYLLVFEIIYISRVSVCVRLAMKMIGRIIWPETYPQNTAQIFVYICWNFGKFLNFLIMCLPRAKAESQLRQFLTFA